MTKEDIKRLAMLGLFVWCAGTGVMTYLAVTGVMNGPTVIIISLAYAVIFVGVYLYLELSGKM